MIRSSRTIKIAGVRTRVLERRKKRREKKEDRREVRCWRTEVRTSSERCFKGEKTVQNHRQRASNSSGNQEDRGESATD